MNRARIVIALSAASFLLPGLSGCGGSDIAPLPPDLSGSWKLNVSQSDLPPTETEDVMIDSPRRPGPPEGGYAPPGRRRPRGPGPGGFNPAEMRERLREMMEGPRQLTISQTDSTLILAGVTGLSRTLFTDGRKRKRELRGVGEVETKARWKDGALMVERKFGNGLKLNESFERSQDGQRLSVLLELHGGPMPRELRFKRVYDLVSEEAQGG